MKPTRLIAVAAVAVLLAVPVVAATLALPASGAAAPRLVASVGPGFTITLTRGGRKVTRLAPGRYTISVRDRSSDHNFHLVGPGLNKTTSVDAAVTRTWTVTFRRGTYRYVCDPHAGDMRGSFRVA